MTNRALAPATTTNQAPTTTTTNCPSMTVEDINNDLEDASGDDCDVDKAKHGSVNASGKVLE